MKYNKKMIRKMYKEALANLEEDYNFQVYLQPDGTKFYLGSAPKTIHRAGTICSLVTKSAFGDGFVILTDEIFDELPVDYQKFFIEHERAHALLGHLDVPNYKVFRRFFKNSVEAKMEFEADKAACEATCLKTAVNALNWLLNNVSFEIICRLEIKRRIKILKKEV